MSEVFAFFCFNLIKFQEKSTLTPIAHPQSFFFLCVIGEFNPLRGYRDTNCTSSMNIASPYKKFHVISKISHSFHFQEKSKLTPSCTDPVYVLSMCKRKIKSVEGLLRYRPYKLINIASMYKKFHVISKISHSVNFQDKSKLTPCCTAPVYVLFICKRKIKSVQGLLRNRPYKLMNIASPYKKFYSFQIFLISLNF